MYQICILREDHQISLAQVSYEANSTSGMIWGDGNTITG